MIGYFSRKRFHNAIEAQMGIPWNYVGYGSAIIYGMWLTYRRRRNPGETPLNWLVRTHSADELRAIGGARWHLSELDVERYDEMAEGLRQQVQDYVALAVARSGAR